MERLVLLGPVVNGIGFSQHFSQRERRNSAPRLRGDLPGAIEAQVTDPFAFPPGDSATRQRVRATLTANPQNLRNLLTVEQFEQRPDVPAGARLGDVRVPTLILLGEHDIPDVHAHAGAIEYGVGSVRREVIPGGGHLVQLDHPLFPVNDSTYYAVTTATPFRVTFHRAAGGAVGAADLDFGTVTRRATPIKTER